MKAMETLQDLIEEAKLRTVWWALCIFVISYFLTHTSKSMWMNVPISILFVYGLRILFNEVEFHWKGRAVRPQTYLSHLEKKQLSVNDSRLSCTAPPPRWKRKIDSPTVEAAMRDFIDKILKDFVIDLWYSEITTDREFPEQIHTLIMDALGEISGRVKEINLVDLLTRDIVDLVGDHLDLFRRNQAAIGVDVMGTLSSEERDERLKHHLMASKELHPALTSPESEYKVLQRLMSGVLTVVLRSREVQCPVVRSIARELLTCLVMQPIMNFASPGYINELIEYVVLATKDDSINKDVGDQPPKAASYYQDHSAIVDDDSSKRKYSSINQGTDLILAKVDNRKETSYDDNLCRKDPLQPRHSDWARMLDVATQRRTEVLMPDNLDNMWTKGRNYKRKENKTIKVGVQEYKEKGPRIHSSLSNTQLKKETFTKMTGVSTIVEENVVMQLIPGGNFDAQLTSQLSDKNKISTHFSEDSKRALFFGGGHSVDEVEFANNLEAGRSRSLLKRSNSTSALKIEPDPIVTGGGGSIISEFYSPNFSRLSGEHIGKSASNVVIRKGGELLPKLRCRVMGAYFEKLGSKSFAVYSIAVTDPENRTWFVKRRYRNFERLHRYLKDIPNYTLHLPPKRIFSSSTEDAFVHQRCIQLDKYLQDLLSIANVAEQHEVWDFLSLSSKSYSFGKSSSVMRTLAVNVDDAVDDIVRQFKGVSDGLMRKVVGSTSPTDSASSSIAGQHQSWSPNDLSKNISRQYSEDIANSNSFSENEEDDKNRSHNHGKVSGWHSDNELDSKSFPPRVIKRAEELGNLSAEKKHDFEEKSGISQGGIPVTSSHMEDPIGMPPEWTPPNVSVPLLNLVDKIFQLNRRGWIRRQVLWISKQILQLIMEDAIDDWLVRQIHWLRRDDVIAQGIRWVQDVLWPDGTFFLRLRNAQTQRTVDDIQLTGCSSQAKGQSDVNKLSKPGSFEQQLEAARRASGVKKMLFGGAPKTLVGLIGTNQYKRCAKDIYYFTQSTICVKQLGYAILELLLISVFPELRNLVLEVHEKTHVSQPV